MSLLARAPRAVLFDLDGTLTDPAAGITRCLAHALVEHELAVPPYETLLAMIGPPWEDELPSIGVPEGLVASVIAAYRSEYETGGLYEATLYDGVANLLETLHADGIEVCLATSKPTPSATRVVEHFGLLPWFTVLGGATVDGSRRHKHDVIAHVLEQLGHRDAVMVGDRKYDVLGARHHGLPCVSVTWGHAPDGELDDAGPAASVDTAEELLGLLQLLPRG